MINVGNTINYVDSPSTTAKIKQAYILLKQVGFLYYWLLSALISTIVFVTVKEIVYNVITIKLKMDPMKQSWQMAVLVFLVVFLFSQGLSIKHILAIYRHPLVETIKPEKRTYDLVKVRLIDLSTFGISFPTLLSALLLTYYGVVSYYLIPYSILTNHSDAQVFYFNSILVLMNLGSMTLISIFSYRLEELALSFILRLRSSWSVMRSFLLKNLLALRYRNVMMTLILAIIFGFLLFFVAGVKNEIRIVQSFIERSLGSDLVLQNYDLYFEDTSTVNGFLKDRNLSGAWLSANINHDDFKVKIENHLSGKTMDPAMKVLTSGFLQATYNDYYVPSDYAPEFSYGTLPNGLKNGFDAFAIEESPDPDFAHESDPFHINTGSSMDNFKLSLNPDIIPAIFSSALQQKLGSKIGSIYRMYFHDKDSEIYYARLKVVHIIRALPGYDVLPQTYFISEYNANRMCTLVDFGGPCLVYEKLFVKGQENELSGRSQSQIPLSLNGIGPTLASIMPDHTQIFEMWTVTTSFALLQTTLDSFMRVVVLLMTLMMVLFVFVYTRSMCKDQARNFKVLRSVGATVQMIRQIVFLDVIVRAIVAVAAGLLLGHLLNLAFTLQIEEFLMIQTAPVEFTGVIIIAFIILFIFGFTVFISTRYLTSITVASTAK